MIIHKGPKYQITVAEGLQTAEKSDGTMVATMAYYPERDAAVIAGTIDESTAWRLLRDIAKSLPSDTPVSPEHILIDGDGFILAEWSRSHDPRFCAPEGYSEIWALGATAFYIFMGCTVFQGLGGRAQRATTPIPTMRRDAPELSNLVARCLSFDPAKRPDYKEIVSIAEKHLLTPQVSDLPLKKPLSNISPDTLDQLWPEEMS